MKLSKTALTITVLFLSFLSCRSDDSGHSSDQHGVSVSFEDVDREYRLQSTMIGYTGIGGVIDGVLNPVLQAKKGEIVKITIINGELMPHDIALESLGIASDVIIDPGDSTSIEFEAIENDIYYCTIPGHREAGMAGQFEVVEEFAGEVLVVGVLPEKEGRPLNLDFETGTLDDWTASGNAFADQPVQKDPSPLHSEEMNIGHSGDYFLSSGGTENHEATGTLTSVSFEVTHPYAAFMVSGGALQETRVELVRADTEEVFFQITGNNHATLRPVVVDLEPYLGERIFIRIIDSETGESDIPYIPGNIWAHINFDDFRFYDERPFFVNELRPDDIVILPVRDIVRNRDGLSGEDAARAMELPEGFEVRLAAAEPDVVRPIAMAMDDRGRVWIAEGHTYPQRASDGEGKDRILIFEDTNGDGKLDNRKIFTEGLNLVSGIEVGFGGLWVGAAPYLMFIPIDADTDQPAGDPEILLNGWGYQDTHETLNSFRWGPDGWLYGVQGIFTHSNVGKPGVQDNERQRINAGIWRYHPTQHEFDVVAHGTSNPWGIDFNDVGHAFTTVCVIPHLFHVIPGARYHRQAGEHFNPYTFDDIKTIADHVHYVGNRGPHAGNFRSDETGGGHAHAGAMFYLGNDHWGMDRDAIFMNNIHGYRVNTDHIWRDGSGYTASHGEDFLKTHDSWSQWLNYRIGPDGSVTAIDWYDKNQCHSPNPDVHEKTLGRIFNITHEKDEWVKVDLSQKSSPELAELQLHQNDFYVRHARRILQERGPDEEVHDALKDILENHPEVPRKLRALWALHVTGGVTENDLQELLIHSSEYIRGWAIQLLMDMANPSDQLLDRFVEMARTDESALVRLNLASAMQRVAPERRWEVLEELSQKDEDAGDQNLPLMFWYAAEPLAEVDMNRVLELAEKTELPNILTYTIRRVAVIGTDEAVTALERFHDRIDSHDHRHIITAEIDRMKDGQ
ncbi:MAG: HEAT repeat domain-containing protein [Balneolaceae bacterium]|nr:HEAT repeat domain-containing protein [Balneolaceae bacterium]